MKPKSKIRHFLALAGSSLLAISLASSAELFWSANGTSQGGAGTWDTTNENWGTATTGPFDSVWNNANNDTARFGSTAGTVTLDDNVTVGGLVFNTNNYIIAPGTGPFGINFGASGDINVSTGTSIINAAISGGAITKTGGGTLSLGAANTFDGLTLNEGRVFLQPNATLGAAGSAVTVTGNSSLEFSTFTHNNSLHVESGVTLTTVKGGGGAAEFTGVVSGSGTIKVNDAGSVNQRPFVLSNTANTFTGTIDLLNNRSTITVGSLSDVVGSGNILFGGASSAFQLGATADSPMVLTNRAFDIQGATTTGIINNNNTASSSANTLTVNSDLIVTTAGNKNFQLGGTNTGANTFAGSIGDSTHGSGGIVSFIKADAGRWVVNNAANSYTGTTTISGGILEVTKLANGGSNSSIGASTNAASNLSLAHNTTLRYTGSGDTTDRSFRINATNNGQGATLDSSGTGAINFTNAATPEYGTIDRTRTLTLRGTNTGANTLAATITDNGTGAVSISKQDAGTWVLSGDNSYTGTTLISAGSLLINGNSSTATGNVTVSSGATLGGTGTVGGNTTISGFLSPGNSPGTLTFDGNLTLNNASTYYFEGGDLTDVKGTLILNNTWNLALGTGLMDGGSVTLFTYGIQGATFNLTPMINTDDLGFTPSGSLFLTNTGSSIVLNGVSVIPEPRAALLGGIGLLILVRRRR